MWRWILFVAVFTANLKLSQQQSVGGQISSLLRSPFLPDPSLPPAQVPIVSVQCAVGVKPLPRGYEEDVDKFVKSLNSRLPLFRDPFVSDFDQDYRNVSELIKSKILEISGASPGYNGQNGYNRQQGPDFQWCKVFEVAQAMGKHPQMNYKFWLRAYSKIISSRPELANSMKSDLLESLEGFFTTAPEQPMPAFSCPAGVPCAGPECQGRRGETGVGNEDLFWYFREDIGMNFYHHQWHEDNTLGPPTHRGGELFYYFHRNILARYNTERVTHSIPAAAGLRFTSNNFLNPGYHPKLERFETPEFPRGFLQRQPNAAVPATISARFQSRYSNFLYLIGFMENEASSLTLSGHNSADALSKRVETLVHNEGHGVIGSITGDPPRSVMLSFLHALRDPIFYQWHGYVDSVVHMHKRRLGSYQPETGNFALSWSGIRVQDISVVTETSGGPGNTLHTFWKHRKRNEGNTCRKELDHEDFSFNLNIVNPAGIPVEGTVRIFLAPSKGADGRPLSLEGQQDLYFALEIFNKTFNPGQNVFSHSSKWLSTTAPRWNDPILLANKRRTDPSVNEVACGCGYPHNLLLPMGNDCPGAGEEFDLVVIVTNADRYKFTLIEEEPNPRFPVCKRPRVLCGYAAGIPYPDESLPMGYPFDRYWAGSGHPTIADLVSKVPNMAVRKINIVHHDALLEEGSNWTMLSKGTSTNPRCVTGPPQCPNKWYEYNGVERCDTVPDCWECVTQNGRKYCKPSNRCTTPPPDCVNKWYDQNGAEHCESVPDCYDCTTQYGRKYCQSSNRCITTECPGVWYEYNGVKHCDQVPACWECTTQYGRKYCQPFNSCPTIPPDPCWYDYSGRRHCFPIPPGCHCNDYNGYKYCQVTVTTTTPRPGCFYYPTCTPPTQPNCYYNNNYQICPTQAPRTDCYYDQYMTRTCAQPPTNYNCVYNNNYKQCSPPAGQTGGTSSWANSLWQILGGQGQGQGYGWTG